MNPVPLFNLEIDKYYEIQLPNITDRRIERITSILVNGVYPNWIYEIHTVNHRYDVPNNNPNILFFGPVNPRAIRSQIPVINRALVETMSNTDPRIPPKNSLNFQNVPEGSTEIFSQLDVKDDPILVNMKNGTSTYYNAKAALKWLNTNPISPMTRQPVTTLEFYRARVMPSNSESNTGTNSGPNVNIRFRTLVGKKYETTVSNNSKMSFIVKEFGRLRGEDEIMNYIHFIGIPTNRDKTDFFLKPALDMYTSNRRQNIAKDLSKKLKDYNENDTSLDIFIVNNISHFGILSTTFHKPNSFKNLENSYINSNINLQSIWINISNELTNFVREKLRLWLSQHPTDYNKYKLSFITSALLAYGNDLKRETKELLDKKVKEVIDEYSIRPSNNRRTRNNRRNRRTRKNRRSY